MWTCMCVVDNGRFELPSSLPSTAMLCSSFDAPCIEFERKTKYFFKHCRNANAVYGLLIFSAKISNANFSFLASLSNARCCWEEKTPFSREIIFHPRFLFLPRLYQDFHALACVGHSVVPLCMLLRCVGWHMAQWSERLRESKENVVDDARDVEEKRWNLGWEIEVVWGICSGHMCMLFNSLRSSLLSLLASCIQDMFLLAFSKPSHSCEILTKGLITLGGWFLNEEEIFILENFFSFFEKF